MRTIAAILLGLALCTPVLAQKRSIPRGDISRTVHGQVFFRNADGSVRPAPFMEVHVWRGGEWWDLERKEALQQQQKIAAGVASTSSLKSLSCVTAIAIETVNVGIMRKEFLRAFQTDEKGSLSGTLPGNLSDGDALVFVAALNSDSAPFFVWEGFLIIYKGEASKIVLTDPNNCK